MVEEQNESEELDLPFDIMTLLIRLKARWKFLCLCALIAVLSGVSVAMLFGSRVFEAEAVLHYRPSEVEQKPPNLLTLLNMVKLQENLEDVRDRLKLSVSLTSLSRAFKVDVRRDTELLVIQAKAGSPDEAALLAATLRDVFLESQERKRRTKLESVEKSLEKRLDEVTTELKTADEALQEFTVTNRIVDLDKEAQWYLEELTSLQIMLEEAQVHRTSVRQKAENVDRIVGELKAKVAKEKAESQTEFDSLGDINIRVQRLRAAIHDDKTQRSGEALLEQKRLELERAQNLKSKGLISDSEFEKKLAAYNSQKALTVDTEQVSEWKSQVDELNAKAIPNKENNQAQSGPILQEMMLKAFDIQLELVTQDKRVDRMKEAVARARKRLDALPQLQRNFAALSRDVKAIEVQKSDLEDRLGDTRRLLSNRLLDFVIASEPKLRPEPVSSNRRLLAAAAAIVICGLGFVLCLGRELMDPRSLSGPELAAKTGMEVFGVLPGVIAPRPGRAENLLVRSLPQKGVLVLTSVQNELDLQSVCQLVCRAFKFQGVACSTVDFPGVGQPPSFYRSQEFRTRLSDLAENSQVVLIPAPNLEESVSADILAETATGVIVVVDTKAHSGGIKKATSRILDRVLGLILCEVTGPHLER